MSQASPVLIGVPTPYDESVTGASAAFDNMQPKGPRLIRYNDAIYAVYRFYNGAVSLDWRVTKSTDDGLTWANLDTVDEPVLTFQTYLNDKVILQGSKIRILSDYITIVGSTRTYQVRIYTFNLTTEQWEAHVTGPSFSIVGNSHCFQDACLRGLDEIIVCYNPSGASGNALQVDIYNTASATWTTTGIVVFDSAGPFGIAQARTICWDGTYVHFFSDLNTVAPFYMLHCTMSAANVLGTETDLLTIWDAGWADPTINVYGVLRNPAGLIESVCVHGGKIYAFAWGRPTSPYSSSNHQVFCWHANIGEAVPTFSVEGVYLPVFASAQIAAVGPTAFVSNGTLHLGFLHFRSNYTDRGIAYTKRLSGTWSTPADIYTYNGNEPIFGGYAGSPSSDALSGFAPLPDTRNAARFAVMASIEYDYSTAVWYCSEAAAPQAVGVRY